MEKPDREAMEKLVPAALTGPVREKAVDAALLAIGLLQMSKQDVTDRVAEIAREHGVEPASPKAWLSFYKECKEKLATDKNLTKLSNSFSAQKLDLGKGADRDHARRLGSAMKPGVMGVAWEAAVSGERAETILNRDVGSHADSPAGMNGVFSLDASIDQTDEEGKRVEIPQEYIPDTRNPEASKSDLEIGTESGPDSAARELSAKDFAAERDAAEAEVDSLHRKAATYLKDRDYIGFRTLMENGHLLGNENKGRGKGEGTKIREGEEGKVTIASLLKTNLLYTSEASVRGAIPDIYRAIRKIHHLPDPQNMLMPQARERMEKSVETLREDLGRQAETKQERQQTAKRLQSQQADLDFGI